MPPKGERRKTQIITTAKEMFIERGFQSTHIGQVCEKLNIARGTVYQYFSNKKEILYAILEVVGEKMEDVLDEDDLKDFINKNPDTKNVLKFISDRVSESIKILTEEPIVIMLIFKDIVGIDMEVIDRVNRSVLYIARLLSRWVDELKIRGIFKADVDSKITASMLVGGIMIIVYEYYKKNLDVLDANVINAISNTYLFGILK